MTQTRPVRPAINATLILDAALGMIEREGLEGLSMRKLGEVFEIQAPSIYWYFKSKEELLDRLGDELYGRAAVCLRQREYGDSNPDECLRAALTTYREFLLRRAHLAEVFGLSRPVGPGYAMLVEELIELIRQMSFPIVTELEHAEQRREKLGQIAGLLLDYVHGAVRTQQAPISGGRNMVEAIAELDSNLNFTEVAAGLHRDFADRFQIGLTALLAGLQ